MTKKAPVELTGGEGFRFEDQVAARLLLDMLGARWPFGVGTGRVRQLHWQARDSGWLLDDVVVDLFIDRTAANAAVSIKSDRQVTQGGFPMHFVRSGWQHALGKDGVRSLGALDALVLVVGKLANAVQEAWDKLLKEALAAPDDRVLARIDADGRDEGSQSSEVERKLFESLQCPNDFRQGEALERVGRAAAVQLLRHLRVIHLDFSSPTSRDIGDALLNAQELLRNGDPEQARALWGRLLEIAAARGSTGGSLDEAALLSELRGRFELRDHPDYRTDWDVLAAIASERLADVRTAIPGLPTLERDEDLARLRDALSTKPVCLLSGESGSGKSALAKTLASDHPRAVWLSPEDLESSPIAINGLRHSLQETLNASRQCVLVVVDSAENLSPKALQHVSKLLGETGVVERLNILLIATPEAVARVTTTFAERGLPVPTTVVLARPNEEKIAALLQGTAGLRWTALRPEVRPALRNLKVLEWVVGAIRRGDVVDESKVVNVSDLIDHLWARWIEGGADERAHSDALMRVAGIEGDSLASGAVRMALAPDSAVVLNSLVAKDLVRLRNERVLFTHDMVGDWARLRVLIGEGPEAVAALRDRAMKPRWQRAIRLYGQWLLEQKADGPARWKALLQLVEDGTNEGTIARDLLLESVFLASNAATLLETAWPLLVADDARLLTIGLEHFLYVATTPDPSLLALLGKDTKPQVVQHLFRVPVPAYWRGMLKLLHDHSPEVVARVPDLAARVVGLWLRWTPARLDGGRRVLWREQAATVAVAIARERQAQMEEHDFSSGKGEKGIFEALLYAAPDLPDVVPALCLELCHRRPLSPGVEQRRLRAEEKRREERAQWERENPERAKKSKYLSMPAFPRGPLRAPWSHGPSRRVSEAFCEACRDAGAFSALTSTNAASAREVLLAVCIEEPHEEDLYSAYTPHDDYGMNHWMGGYPAMYFQGPFLRFFRDAPDDALRFTIQLVNFATERWADAYAGWARREGRPPAPPPGVVVTVDATSRSWTGDETVYQWHYSSSLSSGAVHCALMALEFWLQEAIDRGDDVTGVLASILSHSTSLAFAGVLVDLSKSHPALFSGVLKPLLDIWELYLVDSHIVAARTAGMWPELIGWAGKGEPVTSLAVKWYELQHRKRLLWDVATWLLLNLDEMKEHFAEVRKNWSRLLKGGEPEQLRLLIERFTPENYVLRILASGERALVLQWPDDIARRHQGEKAVMADNLLVMSLPRRCRKWLNGEEVLSREQVPDLWETANRIALSVGSAAPAPNEIVDPADALYGCVAVFVVLCSDWLDADQARWDWCRGKLAESFELMERDDVLGELPLSLEKGFRGFAAEAGVALLTTSRDDKLARRLVVLGATSRHMNVIAVTMARAFLVRGQLGDDFLRLQTLTLRWAGIHGALRVGGYLQADLAGLSKGRDALRHAFLASTLEVGRPSLRQIDEEAAAAITELARDTRAAEGRSPLPSAAVVISLDQRTAMAALGWVNLAAAKTSVERDGWLALLQETQSLALDRLARSTAAASKRERGQVPDGLTRWMLGHVARAIPLVTSSQAEALWRPILALGPVQHYWVETFLGSWFRHGGEAAPTVVAFTSVWEAMIRFALNDVSWAPRSSRDYDVSRIACELLGFRSSPAVSRVPAWPTALAAMHSTFDLSATRWFSLPPVAESFARFIATKEGEPLLLPGLVWLAAAVSSFDDDAWDDRSSLADALVGALRAVWSAGRIGVASEPKYRESFRQMLTILAARGSHVAQSFRDEIVDSIAKE